MVVCVTGTVVFPPVRHNASCGSVIVAVIVSSCHRG